MPLERLALIVVVVLAAAGLTIWIGALVVSAFAMPWYAVAPGIGLTALVLYVVLRAIAERRADPTDRRYDEVDH